MPDTRNGAKEPHCGRRAEPEADPVDACASDGCEPRQILRHLIYPHMIPSFFAGMRLGMTGVLLSVLLGELYVSTAGIGHFTTMFTQSFDPTRLRGSISVLR